MRNRDGRAAQAPSPRRSGRRRGTGLSGGRVGRIAFLAATGLIALAGCADGGPPALRESEQTGIVFARGVQCLGARARGGVPRVVFVSPGGDDRNAGASPAAPMRTLAHALCSLRPGQTLNVLPGVYRESVVLERFGTKGRPITIRGVVRGGRRPVLDGESKRSYGIALGESRNVIIEQLEFRNYRDAGLHALLCSDLVVRRNRFLDNGRASVDPDADGEGFGLNVVGGRRVVIEQNLVVGNGPNEERRKRFVLGTGIDTYELEDAVIRGNTVRDTIGGGILVEDGRRVLVAGNAITQNELDANGDYWDGGIWLDGSIDVTLRGNRVTANHGPGVEISDEDHQYPRASRGYLLEGNTVTANLFGLYVWNYGRCPLMNPRILRLVGNRIEGNSRHDFWCLEHA